jgi:hypothetical protein
VAREPRQKLGPVQRVQQLVWKKEDLPWVFSPVHTNPEGWFSFDLRLTYLAAATFMTDFANVATRVAACRLMSSYDQENCRIEAESRRPPTTGGVQQSPSTILVTLCAILSVAAAVAADSLQSWNEPTTAVASFVGKRPAPTL